MGNYPFGDQETVVDCSGRPRDPDDSDANLQSLR